MAAKGDSSAAPSSQPPWYPFALLDRPCDPSTFGAGLPSPWGRIHGWDYTQALNAEWWNANHDGRWGEWPADITTVELVSEHRFGVVLHLNGTWVAAPLSLPNGKRRVHTLAV